MLSTSKPALSAFTQQGIRCNVDPALGSCARGLRGPGRLFTCIWMADEGRLRAAICLEGTFLEVHVQMQHTFLSRVQ